MKKSDLLLIGAVLVIIIISMFSSKGMKTLEDIDFPLELVGDAGMHQITYKNYENFVSNGDAFIVVIERAGCSYCIQYMPIVEAVAKEKNIPLYYIDTDTLSDEDMNKLSTTNDYLKKNDWGTPTTLFMLGDRVIDSISGYVNKDTLLEFIDGRVVIVGD
jgi:predicted bacteriocin transport accessory protein